MTPTSTRISHITGRLEHIVRVNTGASIAELAGEPRSFAQVGVAPSHLDPHLIEMFDEITGNALPTLTPVEARALAHALLAVADDVNSRSGSNRGLVPPGR
jgi:hypothetical protein